MDFQFRRVGNNVIEVWDGEPGKPESEYILCVAASLVPALIATLKRSIQGVINPY